MASTRGEHAKDSKDAVLPEARKAQLEIPYQSSSLYVRLNRSVPQQLIHHVLCTSSRVCSCLKAAEERDGGAESDAKLHAVNMKTGPDLMTRIVGMRRPEVQCEAHEAEP